MTVSNNQLLALQKACAQTPNYGSSQPYTTTVNARFLYEIVTELLALRQPPVFALPFGNKAPVVTRVPQPNPGAPPGVPANEHEGEELVHTYDGSFWRKKKAVEQALPPPEESDVYFSPPFDDEFGEDGDVYEVDPTRFGPLPEDFAEPDPKVVLAYIAKIAGVPPIEAPPQPFDESARHRWQTGPHDEE